MPEPKNPFLERTQSKLAQDHQANSAQERPKDYKHSAAKVGLPSPNDRLKGLSGEQLREYMLERD